MTQETGPTFATIDEALADIRAGRTAGASCACR